MASTSEIYIQATETDPEVRAGAQLREIHQGLQARLATLSASEATREGPGNTRAALAEFCRGELQQYLSAAWEVLWSPAVGAAGTGLLVRTAATTRGVLDGHLDTLTSDESDDSDEGENIAQAQALSGALHVYLKIEEAVLLPALANLPGTDPVALIADLNTLLEGGWLDAPDVIDVREIPRAQRHPRIFTRFARLGAEEAFVLVNDHDPAPLRGEFEAAYPGMFSWEYLEQGPEEWRVRIGRPVGRSLDNA